jgi:hypothetical protein
MTLPQLGQELYHRASPDVLRCLNEEMLMGLDAIHPDHIVTVTAAVAQDEMGFATLTPTVGGFGVVMKMHRIPKIDTVIGVQFTT